MFHAADTGMEDHVPADGGEAGEPEVGRKSHVPFSEARTRPSCGRDCGPASRRSAAALATRGIDASAKAAAPVPSTCRRLSHFSVPDIVVPPSGHPECTPAPGTREEVSEQNFD